MLFALAYLDDKTQREGHGDDDEQHGERGQEERRYARALRIGCKRRDKRVIKAELLHNEIPSEEDCVNEQKNWRKAPDELAKAQRGPFFFVVRASVSFLSLSLSLAASLFESHYQGGSSDHLFLLGSSQKKASIIFFISCNLLS